MRRKRTNRESGVVLIAVIWGVFVLTAMAFALSALVRSGSEELRARKEHLQAYYVARGAVRQAVVAITAPPQQGTDPVFVPGQRQLVWNEDGMQVSVEVSDEGGKIDLNAAKPDLLERLFQNLGMSFSTAHHLVAAIEDWRDADSDTRLDGAEDSYYTMLPQPYHAANQDFRSVEELLLVRGVTPDLFYGRYVVNDAGQVVRRWGIVDCLTVNSHATAVNINYAPYPVLMSIPGMDAQIANFMLQGREKKPFKSVSDFVHDYPIVLDAETMGYLGTGSSGRYSLVASSTTSSGITARVRALVQVNGMDVAAVEQRQPDGTMLTLQAARPGPPFLILGWDDSYVR